MIEYRDVTGDEEQTPSKIALAMRRYRNRRAKGERCFRLYCSARFPDVLVEEGFLAKPETPQDIDERVINEGIYRLLNAWRQRPR
jgi:hypothetical protein